MIYVSGALEDGRSNSSGVCTTTVPFHHPVVRHYATGGDVRLGSAIARASAPFDLPNNSLVFVAIRFPTIIVYVVT